ncbi:MAG: histidine kinase, partial [Armatimonadetes bacterium]|nr:histidine kinase [Armatimonadota bacterium]
LMPAVGQYLHQYSLQSGIHVDLVTPGRDTPRLSPLVEIQLLRIIQEALANVRKHASASRAAVRFDTEGGFLVATIEDDGRGIDNGQQALGRGPRFGLQTMRERAESVGGTFTVESAPGHGTTVIVKVPLSAEGVA